MQYLISFLEGIITFISPCMLPLLPVYISYFAGGNGDKARAVKNSLGFVLGFTMVFVAMGAFAGTLGVFLMQYRTALNIITGLIVILFGLSFLGVLKVQIFKGSTGDFIAKNKQKTGILTAVLFGIVFSIGWTPCVGVFLGSALMLASQQGSVIRGIVMLLCYSIGLGLPFILSAALIDKLKSAFQYVKRNYRLINLVCGNFLVIVGILMMTGVFGKWLTILSF